MIIDTSVIITMLNEEPEVSDFLRLMAAADTLRMSAGSRMEVSIVTIRRLKHPDRSRADRLIERLNIRIVPVSPRQAELADSGYRLFGQVSGHPARLNFGDCFAYALARESGEPLLFKGDDFIHTDITPAL